MEVWDFIAFNFETRVPEEVNWYMRQLLGCDTATADGKNYRFLGAETRKDKTLFAPIGVPVPPPAPPAKKDFNQMLTSLWLEASHERDPRQNRYECMLSTMQQGVDDRVILWHHIAPDDHTPYPGHLVQGRDITTRNSAVEYQWFAKNIKSMADVDRQPTGNGIGIGNMFVTSLKKALVDLQPNLLMFRSMHDAIIATHQNLDKWANSQEGGSSSMPTEYQSVKAWIARQEASPKSVLNCVIVAGL